VRLSAHSNFLPPVFATSREQLLGRPRWEIHTNSALGIDPTIACQKCTETRASESGRKKGPTGGWAGRRSSCCITTNPSSWTAVTRTERRLRTWSAREETPLQRDCLCSENSCAGAVDSASPRYGQFSENPRTIPLARFSFPPAPSLLGSESSANPRRIGC